MTESFKRGLELYKKEKTGFITEEEKNELRMFRTRASSIDIDLMCEICLKLDFDDE